MTWKLDCGSYTLFVIEDGFYWRDPDGYHPDADEHEWRFHPRNEVGKVRMNFGCYLITDGDHTVMVDSGIGDTVAGDPGITGGLMPDAVEALGVDRASVDAVIYSHMHYDHIGGTIRDGNVVFPNARHIFHENEWAHWKVEDSEFGQAARRIVEPLLEADRVEFIDKDTEIVSGVTAVEAFGHTPGHITVSIISDGTRTLIGGDVSNHPFQVEHPHWSLPVDGDQVMAGATRDRVFDELRASGTKFVAGHYPMPGVGKIVTEDGVRVYQPTSPSKIT